MDAPIEEARRKLREKYRRSFTALKTSLAGPGAESAVAARPHPELEGLDEVRRALDILSTSAALAPASEVAPPSPEEREIHRLKMTLISEFSAGDAAKSLNRDAPEKMRAALGHHFEAALTKRLAEERMTATGPQRQEILKSLVDEILGHGPLEFLLENADVSEIMVNGPRTIFVERGGRLEKADCRFFDDNHMMNVIDRIVSRLGRSIDLANPHVDARLPDGSRVHAIIPPLAIDGPVLTIRKFKSHMLQMEDLLGFEALTPEMAYFLGACVKARVNIVVSGGTGTGKTTILNVLSSLIPPDQRIITIEDSAELKVRESHPHVVRLECRPVSIAGKGVISIRDLVRDALRMRPDRIIVGEVRGGEAMDMLQAMNTGHDGSMTTAHANSAIDCFHRLESMCLMSGLELPSAAIRTQIASAIELVVQSRRYPDGSRKISEIREVTGCVDGRIESRPLFWYEVKGRDQGGRVLGEFRIAEQPPAFLHKFDAEGLAFPDDIFTVGGAGEVG
jgi:pilus assembly protein CpaF